MLALLVIAPLLAVRDAGAGVQVADAGFALLAVPVLRRRARRSN